MTMRNADGKAGQEEVVSNSRDIKKTRGWLALSKSPKKVFRVRLHRKRGKRIQCKLLASQFSQFTMVVGRAGPKIPLRPRSTFYFGIDLCRPRMIAAGIERQAKDSPLLLSEMEVASTASVHPGCSPEAKTEIHSQKSMEDTIVFGLPQPLWAMYK